MAWSLLSAASTAVPVGDYAAWWKVIPVVIVLILCGRLVTWIDKDCQPILLPRVPLNVGNLMGGILAFLLFFLLPGFAVGFLALCVVVAIELGAYLAMRNAKVGLGDIGDQFKDWIASWKGEKIVKVIA